MAIKIAQINAQRSAAASADLEMLMKHMGVDVLCLQEPYSYKGKVKRYTSTNLRTTQPDGETPWVAIITKEEKVQVFNLVMDKSEHVMCVQVKTETEEFYLINAYCQYSLPINPMLQSIERILDKIGNFNVIITMDSNAKSRSWYAEETDERGKIVEEFLLHRNLYVINEPNNISTFLTTRGESNIDLTITSGNLLGVISEWKVRQDCATSDHNIITFKFELVTKERRKFYKKDIYNIKRARWDNFERLVEEKFNDKTVNEILTMDSEKASNLFMTTLKEVCDKSIPKKKGAKKAVPWWNTELDILRRATILAKRQLIRARKLRLNETEEYERTYKRARNKYVKNIQRRKKDTWQEFVTTEGNKDPWSLPYKIARERLRVTETACSVLSPDGGVTLSWRDTFEVLMKKAAPSDNPDDENERHAVTRKENDEYINFNVEENITDAEIDNEIRKLKKNKAPGLDGIQNEILKFLWKCKGEVISNLLNNCLRNASFPRDWKAAAITFILKDRNKDKTKIESYRPISLLPTMSKLYERIIVERLQVAYREKGLESERQFGFRKKKSTDDAFLYLRRGVERATTKYVMAVFVDIEGAFDNLWWQAILARIRRSECSGILYQIIRNYFKDRCTVVKSRTETLERSMERGCPQGSILGPMAWNWCMDELLKEFEENFDEAIVKVIAYADDLAILIKGNSRRDLESQGKNVLRVLNEWCFFHKLKISKNKTTAMMLKGKMDKSRQPILKLNETNIKFKTETKYLGLVIDDRLNFISHTKYLRNKVTNLVMAIRRIARDKWGIKRHIMNVLYDAVALPIITYGSAGWHDKTDLSMVRRNLMATQRALLLLLTKACRTASTVSMQVIAGKAPLDLEIKRKGIITKIKKNVSVVWGNYEYKIDRNEELNLGIEMSELNDALIFQWQQRWNSESRGRNTYQFIANVDFAIKRKWFLPSRQLVYVITGYGPIKASLFKRGIIEENLCDACKIEETVDHLMYTCKLYEDLREKYLQKDVKDKSKLIENQEEYKCITNYVNEMFNKRNTYQTAVELAQNQQASGS